MGVDASNIQCYEAGKIDDDSNEDLPRAVSWNKAQK